MAGVALSSIEERKPQRSRGFTATSQESSRVTGVLVNWDFVMRQSPFRHGVEAGDGAPGHIQILSFLPILAVVAPVPNRRDFTLSRCRRPKDSNSSRSTRHTPRGVAQTTAGSLGHSLQASQIMNGIGPYGLRRNSVLASSSSRDLGRLEHGGPIFTQSSRLPRENSGASSLRSRCARTSRLS